MSRPKILKGKKKPPWPVRAGGLGMGLPQSSAILCINFICLGLRFMPQQIYK